MGGNDTLFSANPIYRYTTGGNKSITLYTENEFGCSDTMVSSNLFNLQPFEVKLRTTSRNNICEGTTVFFRNVSTDRPNNNFIWYFADGDSLISQNDTISHTFSTTGIFNVKLRGQNDSTI